MAYGTAAAIDWVERGLVPDPLLRRGVRHLLRERLAALNDADVSASAAATQAFIDGLRGAPLALLPQRANEQHYEVPAAFFERVLGRHLKYSCACWTPATHTLDEAEAAALQATCERADLADGQQILELGCGWGSLTLWMAERYPAAHITALSNSASQRAYIEAEARRRGLSRVRVITCDINAYDADRRYDRIVSVEMFEHLRNWPWAFANIARWLEPDGRFFMHVFAHRGAAYAFDDHDASDWMSRHFFSGGMMPSDDLALHCQDDLRLLQRWRWDGTHYARTAQAWLHNMDRQRSALLPIFAETYRGEDVERWWVRWRVFFIAVAELFGYDRGQRWWVSHYLFQRRA